MSTDHSEELLVSKCSASNLMYILKQYFRFTIVTTSNCSNNMYGFKSHMRWTDKKWHQYIAIMRTRSTTWRHQKCNMQTHSRQPQPLGYTSTTSNNTMGGSTLLHAPQNMLSLTPPSNLGIQIQLLQEPGLLMLSKCWGSSQDTLGLGLFWPSWILE